MTSKLIAILILSLALVSSVSAQHNPLYLEENLPAVRSQIDGDEAVWWTWLEDDKTIVVNLGPLIYGSDGDENNFIRRWTFTLFMPGNSKPLTCIQGFFVPKDAEPLKAESSDFRIEIKPVRGMTWGDIRFPEEIDATVDFHSS